jgi:hypothetical protein
LHDQWCAWTIGEESQLFCGTAYPQTHLLSTCANADVEAPEEPNDAVTTILNLHLVRAFLGTLDINDCPLFHREYFR